MLLFLEMGGISAARYCLPQLSLWRGQFFTSNGVQYWAFGALGMACILVGTCVEHCRIFGETLDTVFPTRLQENHRFLGSRCSLSSVSAESGPAQTSLLTGEAGGWFSEQELLRGNFL
jgi:hypothetical protein